MSEATQSSVATPTTRRMPKFILVFLVLIVLYALSTQIGVYSIQPIGMLPQGATVLVWRANHEPFFNSPDATCLRIQQGVSLLCRGMALAQAPTDRIIVRLPYLAWAYQLSTNGQAFER